MPSRPARAAIAFSMLPIAAQAIANAHPELQMMLEVGDITEEEYTVQEAQVFQALRDIRARREEMSSQAAAARGEEDEPGIGIFTGYILHPAYLISRADTGEVVMKATKQAAFLEGKYNIERVGDLRPEDETLAVLNVLMMLLLGRRRG